MTTLCEIATNNPPKTWERLFQSSIDELSFIDQKLKDDSFVPQLKDVFTPFYLTPLDKVKVVIFADQPYTTFVNNLDGILEPRAMGLAHSVRPYDKVPKGLENIFIEIKRSLPSFDIPDHGDLREWADQGVLLLNLAFTYHAKLESSSGIWMGFIYRVLNLLSQEVPNCIFLLWGNKVKSIQKWIGEKSIIFEAPDPTSFYGESFIGCDHFLKTNRELLRQNKNPIIWKLKSQQDILEKGFCSTSVKILTSSGKKFIKIPKLVMKKSEITRVGRNTNLLTADQLIGHEI